MEAVAVHSRVAVRSGHKVGKSTLAAALALWWVCTRKQARVILTAPTGRQVGEVLWREVHRLHRNARIKFGGQLHSPPSSGYIFPDGRQLFGFSTDEPEKMAGISGADMLYIVDEASGFSEGIFEAIRGNLAGGASILLIGNPTQVAGTFYDVFTTKSEGWQTFHISSRESPNVVEGRRVIPGLATRAWVEEMEKEWGLESPIYQVRVLGDFPTASDDAVIPLALVEAANEKHRSPKKDDGPLVLGLDPARFGADASVLAARRGNFFYQPVQFRGLDGPQLAGKVVEWTRAHISKDATGRILERPQIKIDVIGIGSSVFDVLNLNDLVEAIPVNVGEGSGDEVHERLRDRVWFAMREWLKAGGTLPQHKQLTAELIGPKYSFSVRGRRKVESKDDMKARLGRSPDFADAATLAVFNPEYFRAAPAGPEALEFMKY